MLQGILRVLEFHVRTPCRIKEGLAERGPSTASALLRNVTFAQDDALRVEAKSQ
jgi:hypothetical protein